jgi:uncharacterized repeat protein (TIGR03803 family)
VPYASLVQSANGDFFGTTFGGGVNDFGSVFKMNANGAFTSLYSFCSQPSCADGSEPEAPLVRGIDGNFYSTTFSGGSEFAGTIFKITPGGVLTTLHSFGSQAGFEDGDFPYGALLQAADGNFYGTTYSGGTFGEGNVYRITPGGTFTTLYSFCPKKTCADGRNPAAGLTQGVDGDLYGTTEQGGVSGVNCFRSGCGVIFKITLDGQFTTVYSFCSQAACTEGNNPYAGLIRGSNGNLFGVTPDGGAGGHGAVFQFVPESAMLTTLYGFDTTDGQHAFNGLVQFTGGSFYGTTQTGGDSGGFGTVFSLSMGLNPFVETLPPDGTVGSPIDILGTNLLGAKKVSFNGAPAVFSVISNSEIVARVPDGATSGTVRVVTPGGTVSSNTGFRVRP